jgi:hypothetical protein
MLSAYCLTNTILSHFICISCLVNAGITIDHTLWRHAMVRFSLSIFSKAKCSTSAPALFLLWSAQFIAAMETIAVFNGLFILRATWILSTGPRYFHDLVLDLILFHPPCFFIAYDIFGSGLSGVHVHHRANYIYNP